jgi:hypothetical protein
VTRSRQARLPKESNRGGREFPPAFIGGFSIASGRVMNFRQIQPGKFQGDGERFFLMRKSP